MTLLYSRNIVDEIRELRGLEPTPANLILRKADPADCLVDRTQSVNFGYGEKPARLIPDMREMNKSWDDLCRERAQWFIKNKGALPYRLFYSGGMDSTCILCAFIEVNEQWTKENITLVCTEFSRLENPAMWEYLRDNNYKMEKVPGTGPRKDIRNLGIENAIWISGDISGLYFGEAGAVYHRCKDIGGIEAARTMDWHDVMRKTSGSEFADPWCDFHEPIVEKMPFDARDFYSVWWWRRQVLKMNVLEFRFAMGITQDMELARKHIIHFFLTDEFELWSMQEQNHIEEKFGGNDWLTYKWAIRKYIKSVNGDDEYFKHKGKVSSMSSLGDRDYVAVLDDLTYLPAGKFLTPTQNAIVFDREHGNKYDGELGLDET